MLLKKIILRNRDDFETIIENWAKKTEIEVEIFDGKESLLDLVESMVILHQDHNISKENKDLRDIFKSKNIPTHHVDINATINASVSSLKFWIENNKPKNLLLVGDNQMAKTHRLSDYLIKLEESFN